VPSLRFFARQTKLLSQCCFASKSLFDMLGGGLTKEIPFHTNFQTVSIKISDLFSFMEDDDTVND
jgi:hypothetical protein